MVIDFRQFTDSISEQQPFTGRSQLLLRYVVVLFFAVIFAAELGGSAFGQRTSKFQVTGDVRVDESKAGEPGPTVLSVILYSTGMQVFARQTTAPNGRYRFMDVPIGDYYVVIEVEGTEIARTNVLISATSPTEIKQDFALEVRSNVGKYIRSAANAALYKKSTQAIESKSYKDAIATLRQIVASDAGDYPAWADLGMLYFIQKDYDGAEKSYAGSLTAKPDYFPALLSQGRVKLAKADFDGAVASLEAALKVDPKSASANFFLGETYLQMKKGSKAVGYMNAALALDPVGMAEAHLRLAALYNGANLKDKAAAEYEGFLKVKPEYPDRKKLEEYIAANKKP